MKPLNFTRIEIFPALLKFFETNGKEGKSQTIRKAWDDKIIAEVRKQVNETLQPDWEIKGEIKHEKPATYKVGDIVPILWNQRSKYQWFYKKDGTVISDMTYAFVRNEVKDLFFNKHLGSVRITEVFKIEMKSKPHHAISFDGGKTWKLSFSNTQTEECKELAQRDGFATAEQMFRTLGEMYDLSNPKPFYISRYEWI